MTRKLDVLIAGAGIGGLAAAASLLVRGHHVRVFEQSPKLGEVGAGIQVSANGVKVLYDLGLKDALEKVVVRPQAFEFRRYDSGELLQRMPLGASHEEAFGAPYYHVHRADIHAILAAKVMELAPRAISLNARAVGFEEGPQGVTLLLEDGSRHSGDVLVGSDGIKSAIRKGIMGETPAIYTGHVAWRATIPKERLPADIMEQVVTLWCGPKNHAVIYWLCSGQVLNFVGCVEHEEWEEESWTLKRPWGELKAAYEGFHPDVQTIIDAIDKDQCYRWAMNNRKPVHNWSTQRTTLLGDAVHPTLPYLASGAVMAIEDGAVLARCLSGDEDIPAALQRYQRNRSDRTARIVNESTEHGSFYHITDAEEMKRAFAERNITKSRAEWLYCYDPLQVELV